MKFQKLTTATIVALSLGVGMASAASFTKGTVKEVDQEAGKVTIIHEELVDLDMPAMTMVFSVADEAMLNELSEGADIEFVADRVEGKLTVVELR